MSMVFMTCSESIHTNVKDSDESCAFKLLIYVNIAYDWIAVGTSTVAANKILSDVGNGRPLS